jgi:NAD(P)-dependent dehydrogenase (short-subunit alcohol dehydrogenase family)
MKMTKGAQTAQIFGSSIFAGLGIARAASRKGVLNDGASLLFMSSVAGARGTAGMVAYSAAKAAVDGMVRSLACELAARNIRVNSIAAGAIKTEMHERLSRSLNAEGIAEYEGRHLLGFGTSEDVANAALFLMSDASRWITGTSMAVDGGYAAR